jgi:hypothetical protein
MTTYRVVAQVQYVTPEGWAGSRQLPTFDLDSDVQAVTSVQQARIVARDIFREIATCASLAYGTAGVLPESLEFSITVAEV